MSNKKAQGATEYLIILAVVIIVALIVVGAMGLIPGIGSGAKQKASSAFWQTSDVAIPSYALSAAGGNITMDVRNNQKDSMSSLTLSVGGTSATCDRTSLAAGQTTTCVVTKSCAAAGNSFSYPVSIGYTDDATSASYTYTGEGHKLDGKCAN